MDTLSLAKTLLAEAIRPASGGPGRTVAPVVDLLPRQLGVGVAHTDEELSRHAGQLPARQRLLLAEALDQEGEVRITYLDATGARSSRVIEPMELDGNSIVAWCQLRDDERRFTVSRIASVSPA